MRLEVIKLVKFSAERRFEYFLGDGQQMTQQIILLLAHVHRVKIALYTTEHPIRAIHNSHTYTKLVEELG